jgi:GTP-binding protein HflX
LSKTKTVAVEEKKERALLVKLIAPSDSTWETEESLSELGRLVESAGGQVMGRITQVRKRPDPAHYIGRGKASEIKGAAEEGGCDLVIFDDDLSPTQDKNLEKLLGKRVLDRSELILDIFALRARTAQAKLQVELAQLQYILPRLTRMWEHLSRIRGGIGLRGPGEKQLEVDRRVIRKRIGYLRKQLSVVKRRRKQQRRRRSGEYNIAIVGYTNTGKSTLFNILTNSEVSTGDRLFETLDARTRNLDFESSRTVLITDTVGFIRKLPHHLVASFRATLEEVIEADLLLHVIDISSGGVFEQVQVVEDVLTDLGAMDKPVIYVFNKLDLARDTQTDEGIRLHYPDGVFTSAVEGYGIEELKKAVTVEMRKDELLVEYSFPLDDSRSLSRLYAAGKVLDKSAQDGRIKVKVWMEREARDKLLKDGIKGQRVK